MRHSLKFRVVLVGFISLALALIFLAAMGYHMVRKEVFTSARDTLGEMASIKAHHIIHILDVRAKELAQIGKSYEFMNYHERGNPYALGRYMVTLSSRYPYLVYVNKDGIGEIEVVKGEVSFVRKDFTDDPLVMKSQKNVNRTVLSEVKYSELLRKPVVEACFTRLNYFEDFVGTLCVQMPTTTLFYPLREKGGYLFVVTTRGGEVLYPRGHRVVWRGKGRDPWQRVLVDGKEYMAARHTLASLGLNLYALGDLAGISAPVKDFGESIFLLSAVVLLLATAGFYMGSRKAIRPLEDLTQVAKRVAITGELVELGDGPGEGEVGELYMAFKNMLDRIRESHRRLVESENHYRLLAEGIPEMVFSFDREGNILYVNSRVEGLMGISREEFLSGGLKGLLECVYDQDRARAEAFFAGIIREDREGMDEFRVLSRDSGKPRYVMMVVRPAPGGETYTGLMVDLSLTRELEEVVKELDEAHMELLRVQKMAAIGRLASGVAHEINNPLMAIVGYAEKWLEEVRECNPALAEDLEKIYRASMRAAEIVRALQLFSGALRDTEWERVRVDRLFSLALTDLQKRLKGEGVELEWRVEDGISEINVPSSYLREMVSNLVVNARDAIVDSGKGSRIRVEVKKDGDDLLMVVSDDGPGIPRGIRNLIFDPFFTTKPPGRGTGLGLSMVQQMVENLGGTIRVESGEGEGTTFFIRIPLERLKEKKNEPQG